MTKTENYQLNQWAAEDAVRRVDFNEDNIKIDAALSALEQGKASADGLLALQTVVSGKAQTADLTALQKTVEGKADASAVTALQNTVAGKADTSVVTALQSTVAGKASASALAALQTTVAGKADASALAALQNTVAGKGNCQVEFGSYVGLGTSSTPRIGLSFNPKILVAASTDGIFTVLWAGCTSGYCVSTTIRPIRVSWFDKAIAWMVGNTDYSPASCLNGAGVTYYYAAFG